MKLLVVIAILVTALWLGADWLGGLVGRGRENVAAGVAQPVQGLAGTIGEARARADELNRRTAEVGLAAADGMPGTSGATGAYGAAARKQIEAAGLANR